MQPEPEPLLHLKRAARSGREWQQPPLVRVWTDITEDRDPLGKKV